MSRFNIRFLIPTLLLFFVSCTSTRIVVDPDYSPSDRNIEELVNSLPDYSGMLNAAKGSGRAIISEPGNSERITIEFETDTALSLLTIKNRIGIEGGLMLVDQDSILIYDKVNKRAQKVSVLDGRLTSLNELASVNLLDLLNFKVKDGDVRRVWESDTHYRLDLANTGFVLVSKESGLISKVSQPQFTGLPYSVLEYEGYAQSGDYKLPRKITIFSADGDSKVMFQVRSLEINPDELHLTLEIPDDVLIERL